jgi:hypothetical protein
VPAGQPADLTSSRLLYSQASSSEMNSLSLLAHPFWCLQLNSANAELVQDRFPDLLNVMVFLWFLQHRSADKESFNPKPW